MCWFSKGNKKATFLASLKGKKKNHVSVLSNSMCHVFLYKCLID